jgi:hypothetical protein
MAGRRAHVPQSAGSRRLNGCRAHDGRTLTGRKEQLMLVTILVILVILALLGLPTWGYSRSWGYGPSGGLGLIIVIIIVLWLLGVFR